MGRETLIIAALRRLQPMIVTRMLEGLPRAQADYCAQRVNKVSWYYHLRDCAVSSYSSIR